MIGLIAGVILFVDSTVGVVHDAPGPTVVREEPSARGGDRAFTITMYCPTGGWGDGTITRMGTRVRPGVVAVDPRVIPLGSMVWIEGYEAPFFAEDTGGGIKGAWVDIYNPSCAAAREHGAARLNVWWEEP